MPVLQTGRADNGYSINRCVVQRQQNLLALTLYQG